MPPKGRRSFDDEAGPSSDAGKGANPAHPAPGTRLIPAAGSPAEPALPAPASTPHLSLVEQLARTKLIAPPVDPEPVAPANSESAPAAAESAPVDPLEPRSTTISTTVDAEMGSTFISGRVKLQVIHFPALNPKNRVVILNELPGTQNNLDLAQTLCQGGSEVAILVHRGQSGSDGHFGLKDIEKDLRQCMQSTVETGHRDRLWRSTAPLVLIGCGINAAAICGVATEDERLAGICLIEPYVHFARVAAIDASPVKPSELYHHMQTGVVSMVGLELLNEHWEYLAQFRNPMDMAEKGSLDHVPILHVMAEHGLLAGMGQRFSKLMKSRPQHHYEQVLIQGASTQFWHKRQELIDVVSFWVSQLR